MPYGFLAEIRQTARGLVQRPGFTVLAVVILAVVIGATTAILAVVDAVLLQALPYPDDDRLVLIWDQHAERGIERMNVSMPKVRGWQQQATSFEAIGAATTQINLILTGRGEPQRLTATMTSPELLRLTGVEPAAGRIFRADEDRVPGDKHVAILSDELWQREFGGDPSAVGSIVTLGGRAHTVVGVLPDDFVDFPYPHQSTDVWVPNMLASEIYGVDLLELRTSRIFVALGKLADGVSPQRALDELDAIAAGLADEFPESEGGWNPSLEPLRTSFVGTLEGPLLGLAAGAALLLLIGCANVTSLLLVRASGRQAELFTRAALGASRARLFRHALTETALLVGAGGALGIALGASSIGSLASRVPVDWPRYVRIEADAGLFAMAAALTASVALLSALLSILPTLRAGGDQAGVLRGRSCNPSGGLLRRVLVVAEVAVATTLLIGAGLTIHSFGKLRGADTGFNPDGLVALQIDAPVEEYDAGRLRALTQELTESVHEVTGVSGAYVWSPQVPGQSSWYTRVRPQDRPELRDDELPLVRFHYVGAGALDGIGLRFIAGRGIEASDTADGNGAVVISESTARAMWPDEEVPIGQVLRRWNRDSWLTVVGITEDAKHSGRRGLGTDINLDVYFAYAQDPQNQLALVARTSGDPDTAVEQARTAVQRVAPGLPPYDINSMQTRMNREDAIPRFTALLAAGFGGTALFLASIGLYGVLAYTVGLRTREIGLRIALGAQPASILRDVLGRGLRMTTAGVVLGLGVAFALTRWLESLLFEVSPNDPYSFIVTASLLLLVAVAACVIPARRALRVDPQTALRAD